MKSAWRIGMLAAVLAMLAGAALAEDVKVPCSRDVWVSAVSSKAEGWEEKEGQEIPLETDTSMGKTTKLKLKTIQEMAVLDFDLSALKGRKVAGGWLHLHVADPQEEIKRAELPFERKHLLRRIGLSTVSNDWAEGGNEQSYHVDTKGFGASFRQASWSKKPWAWIGSDLTDVTMGNGNTLQCHGELEDLDNLWIRIKVSPEIIQSLLCRDGLGMLVMDDIGYGLANNWIHSREQKGFEPYLVVQVEGEDKAAPAAPKLSVKPAPSEAHLGKGAAAIEIEGDAFCYFVKVNGQDVPRWLVPHPKAGKSTVMLDDLKDSEDLNVEAASCSAAGSLSAPGKAAGKASPALAAPPALPEAWKPKAGDAPVRGGKMRVWAFPEICKVRYTDGGLFEAAQTKADDKAYQKANSVWDGATNTVRLFGAKGEIVSFQLAIEKAGEEPLKDVMLLLDGLAGPGKIDDSRVRMFRVWYVKMAEYADPMSKGQKLSVPMEDNVKYCGLRNQTNQAVIVDVAVPKDAAAGDYKGAVKISAEGVEPFELPVTLKVYDTVIPDKMRFNPEMNIYTSPGKMGSPTFFEAFRVCHYNRCTLSITQAGHNDSCKTPLPQEGNGADVKVKDWTAWDAAFGPLLDGSAFKGLPREGTPIPTCHIPMSHGTPLGVDQWYKYGGPKRGKGCIFAHALLCKPMDEAYPAEYKQGFKSFARQIVTHVEEKGWAGTTFMFYMDAKPNYRETGGGSTYWILDEPYNYDDWMALRWWGSLFMDAVKEAKPAKTQWGFRCDISRPQWTRDWLYGVMTHQYVGGLARKIKRAQIMAKDGPMVNYSYGACNRPSDSHWNSAAWCYTTFFAGADGVLPWQSLGSKSPVDSLKQEDPYGLVLLDVLGKPSVGSIRLMACRRGAQDVELLLNLGEKYGLNREQLAALFMSKIKAQSALKQANEDDAAAMDFGPLDADKFAELREGICKLLEAKK